MPSEKDPAEKEPSEKEEPSKKQKNKSAKKLARQLHTPKPASSTSSTTSSTSSSNSTSKKATKIFDASKSNEMEKLTPITNYMVKRVPTGKEGNPIVVANGKKGNPSLQEDINFSSPVTMTDLKVARSYADEPFEKYATTNFGNQTNDRQED